MVWGAPWGSSRVLITDQTEPPNSETRHRTSPRAHPRPTPPPPRPPLSPRRVGRPRRPPQPPQWALKPPPPAGSGPSPPGPGPGGGGWPRVRPPMAEPGSGGDFWCLLSLTDVSQPRTSAGRSPIVAQSTRVLFLEEDRTATRRETNPHKSLGVQNISHRKQMTGQQPELAHFNRKRPRGHGPVLD